jgi:hypothetical protein
MPRCAADMADLREAQETEVRARLEVDGLVAIALEVGARCARENHRQAEGSARLAAYERREFIGRRGAE